MDDTERFYAAGRAEWREWLQSNYSTARQIWLQFYKKGSGKPSVTLREAMDEALCFGWIDSVMHPLDEESYLLRFTPRKPKSKWSDVNKARARDLIAHGLMTEAGMAVLPPELKSEQGRPGPK
jgi:uncharacterized protein YdeI (YjbR/CyaY-like superfamily)